MLWDENSSKAAEAIVLLELVTVITKKSMNIRSGKIIIVLDCSEVNKLIINKLHKATALVCDGGSEIAAIRQAIEASTIQIEFKLQNEHPKKVLMFRQNLLQWMVCECDKRANEERETIERRNNVTNIRYEGSFAIKEKGNVKSRAIKDAIREIDAQKCERNYAKIKLKAHCDLHDIKARNAFVKSKITTSMIKYAHGINPYGMRMSMMNKD